MPLEVGPQFWRELLAEVTPGQQAPLDPSRMLRQPDARTQMYPGMGSSQSGMGSGMQQGNWQQMLMDPDGLRKMLMQMMFAGRMGL